MIEARAVAATLESALALERSLAIEAQIGEAKLKAREAVQYENFVKMLDEIMEGTFVPFRAKL